MAAAASLPNRSSYIKAWFARFSCEVSNGRNVSISLYRDGKFSIEVEVSEGNSDELAEAILIAQTMVSLLMVTNENREHEEGIEDDEDMPF